MCAIPSKLKRAFYKFRWFSSEPFYAGKLSGVVCFNGSLGSKFLRLLSGVK